MIETAGRAELRGEVEGDERLDLLSSYAFTFMHLGAVAAPFAGVSWPAVAACLICFWVRMFGITAGYHRYFSHRSFKTSRTFQFALAWLGASAGQNGPLWWASHHRLHHRHSDTDRDIHSPGLRGLWWSHAGWILCRKYKGYNAKVVRDLARFPEIRFLSRNHMLAPGALAVFLFALGWVLETRWPALGTDGWQMVGWGFFISTVLLYHSTFLVNSVAHAFGSRRFRTGDHSRNNWWVALITLGEGWHNNHHRWPTSERQGFYWWELDVTHYVLRFLQRLRVVWDLRSPPRRIYEEASGVLPRELQA